MYSKSPKKLKKVLNHIILTFVLLAFLISTNGMTIYYHFCACQQQSYVALMVDRDCCTGLNHNDNCQNENCSHSIIHHQHSDNACKKEASFVKIPTVSKQDKCFTIAKVFPLILFKSLLIQNPETKYHLRLTEPFAQIPPPDLISLNSALLI